MHKDILGYNQSEIHLTLEGIKNYPVGSEYLSIFDKYQIVINKSEETIKLPRGVTTSETRVEFSFTNPERFTRTDDITKVGNGIIIIAPSSPKTAFVPEIAEARVFFSNGASWNYGNSINFYNTLIMLPLDHTTNKYPDFPQRYLLYLNAQLTAFNIYMERETERLEEIKQIHDNAQAILAYVLYHQ